MLDTMFCEFKKWCRERRLSPSHAKVLEEFVKERKENKVNYTEEDYEEILEWLDNE